MALRFIEFKDIVKLNDGDPVAGVCYTAAAEKIIRTWFDSEHAPTVIGYLVGDDLMDNDDEVLATSDFENAPGEKVVAFSSRSVVAKQIAPRKTATKIAALNEVRLPYSTTIKDRDEAREAELASQTRIKSDFDLQELGAIRRRLGRGVV